MLTHEGADPLDRWSGERFELLLEQVTDYAIFFMDMEGRILIWPPGARHLLGYEAADVIGQPFSRFFVPEDVQRGVPEKELQLAADTGRASDDRWTMRKDGTRIWVSGVTIGLRRGTLQGFGKIMRDHTALLRATEHIDRLNEELTEKVRANERIIQDFQASQQELREKVDELERFEQVVVGRELKMASLERELERLRIQLDQSKGR